MAEAKKPATSASAKTTTAKAAASGKPAATKPAAKPATAKPAAKPATAKPAAVKATTAKAAAGKPKTPSAKKPKAPVVKVDTLRMHHLRPAEGANTPKTRVGRGEGGKRGKTAGRGTKGTGARYQVSPRFEGGQTPIHMRIPKLRGFTSPFKVTYQVVNLSSLAGLYPKGGEVTKADLVAKGAVRKNEPVKILGDGDIAVKFTIVDADRVSRSARSKIEAAGGSVNQD
ncbi:MAG: 50S ribosomal protein L15 [Demequinaceae bacterium]|nr:50S ribosomal protein L15 [Demequinaceae bacterium]